MKGVFSAIDTLLPNRSGEGSPSNSRAAKWYVSRPDATSAGENRGALVARGGTLGRHRTVWGSPSGARGRRADVRALWEFGATGSRSRMVPIPRWIFNGALRRPLGHGHVGRADHRRSRQLGDAVVPRRCARLGRARNLHPPADVAAARRGHRRSARGHADRPQPRGAARDYQATLRSRGRPRPPRLDDQVRNECIERPWHARRRRGP